MKEHTNHRKRLKSRFMTQGLDGFEEHQVLELMLFYAIPRVDTNEIAHRLLNKFESLQGVLEASYEDLMKVEGIGESAATYLKLLLSFDRRLKMSKFKKKERYNTLDKVGEYLVALYTGETIEKAYLLCFNNKMEMINSYLISEGTTSSTNATPRSIVEKAIVSGASSIIIAHNHPNGLLSPSNSDIDFTNQLKYFAKTLQINLLEHILVAENSYYLIIRSDAKITFNGISYG